jgi:hypothetical protein
MKCCRYRRPVVQLEDHFHSGSLLPERRPDLPNGQNAASETVRTLETCNWTWQHLHCRVADQFPFLIPRRVTSPMAGIRAGVSDPLC